MNRMNISIPDDLKFRMEQVEVNWSAVAREAFEGELKKIAARSRRGGIGAGSLFKLISLRRVQDAKKIGRGTAQKIIALINGRLKEYRELEDDNKTVKGALRELEYLGKMIDLFLIGDSLLREQLRKSDNEAGKE